MQVIVVERSRCCYGVEYARYQGAMLVAEAERGNDWRMGRRDQQGVKILKEPSWDVENPSHGQTGSSCESRVVCCGVAGGRKFVTTMMDAMYIEKEIARK